MPVENRMNLSLRKVALAASCILFAGQLMAEPKRPECIAPASPAVVST
jgi:putative tricarboxylic transport membrane protein